jgi:hypothetical protein
VNEVKGGSTLFESVLMTILDPHGGLEAVAVDLRMCLPEDTSVSPEDTSVSQHPE